MGGESFADDRGEADEGQRTVEQVALHAAHGFVVEAVREHREYDDEQDASQQIICGECLNGGEGEQEQHERHADDGEPEEEGGVACVDYPTLIPGAHFGVEGESERADSCIEEA